MKLSKNIDSLLQKYNAQTEKRGKGEDGVEPIYNFEEKDFLSFIQAAKNLQVSNPLLWLSVGNSVYCVLTFHSENQDLQFQVKTQEPENFYQNFCKVIQ